MRKSLRKGREASVKMSIQGSYLRRMKNAKGRRSNRGVEKNAPDLEGLLKKLEKKKTRLRNDGRVVQEVIRQWEGGEDQTDWESYGGLTRAGRGGRTLPLTWSEKMTLVCPLSSRSRRRKKSTEC